MAKSTESQEVERLRAFIRDIRRDLASTLGPIIESGPSVLSAHLRDLGRIEKRLELEIQRISEGVTP